MNRQIKQVFSLESNSTEPTGATDAAKNFGIEFVHFDNDDRPHTQHVIPLGKFIADTSLSSEEYLITRSLVAAKASKVRKLV